MLLAPQVRHSLALHMKDLARLRAGGYLQLLMTVEGGHHDLRAQGRLRGVDIQIEQDSVFAPLEERVRPDVQQQEQAPVGPAVNARPALTGEADLRAAVNPRWDLH